MISPTQRSLAANPDIEIRGCSDCPLRRRRQSWERLEWANYCSLTSKGTPESPGWIESSCPLKGSGVLLRLAVDVKES